MKITIVGILFLTGLLARAELVVSVSPINISGQKAVVRLNLQNNFTNSIESARAVCFIQDEQGKMIGESTRWVIGEKKTNLKAGANSKFNFVVTGREPFVSTNLTARISFTRIAFDNGNLVNPHDVLITETNK
jgi:hypothetical protein